MELAVAKGVISIEKNAGTSTTISRSTTSAWSRASISETSPPIEWPTTGTGPTAKRADIPGQRIGHRLQEIHRAAESARRQSGKAAHVDHVHANSGQRRGRVLPAFRRSGEAVDEHDIASGARNGAGKQLALPQGNVALHPACK